MQGKFSFKCFAVPAVAGFAATLLLAPASMASAAGKPAHLTCDSLDHPLGIDSSQPLLSWQLQDAVGKPYPPSDVSWWETGLLKESWKAQWIGYEDPEHSAVRKSGAMWITNTGSAQPKPTPDAKDNAAQGSADTQHDFRFRFQLNGHVKHADVRLGSLDFRYQSSYGEIRSAWDMKGAVVTWLVTIPPNTTAHLPLKRSEQNKFTLDGQR